MRKRAKASFLGHLTSSKPRLHTVSVALPGSIVANQSSKELRTYLSGQIARSLGIFQVDEVVVYDDKLHGATVCRLLRLGTVTKADPPFPCATVTGGHSTWDPNTFLARILQFVETPQYLRRRLFPEHPDLKLAGLLNPLDAPHHMRQHEECRFREGVTLDKAPGTRPGGTGVGSFVDVGLKHPVLIDHVLRPGVRVTVRIDTYDRKSRKCEPRSNLTDSVTR